MKLKIKLNSDTCIGNGSGQASVVDMDTYYHDNGLPFIPSRRIKGLLKESALELLDWNLITEDEYNALFKKGGQGFNTHDQMKIYDAQIKHYDDLCKDIEVDELLTKDRVLDFYTYVRYQTAMKDGIAKENSLRSMRVVKKGTTFYGDVYHVPCLDAFKKICQNVRHMGMNRTRGYGEVSISVTDENINTKNNLPELIDNKDYQLILKLYNDSPIIISKDNSSSTMNYIAGSAILGYFAGQYLKDHEADHRFTELFINGLLSFDNAYISNENYDEYVPNSLSLNKVKDGTVYYDKLTCEDDQKQLSRIHDKYISDNNDIKSPLKEMIYHHARPDDKSIGHVISNEEGNGTFYQLEVLSQDQNFVSTIRGKGKDLKELYPYINVFITLGKSKNTQYGKVSIQDVDALEIKPHMIHEKQVVAQLISPTIILNERTLEESLNMNDLIHELSKELHVGIQKVENKSFVNYTTLSGYNRKWNLPKPVVNAFKEGSTLLLDVDGDIPQDVYIGENKQEGCGHIRFTLLKQHVPHPEYKSQNDATVKHHVVNKNSALYQHVYDKMIKEKILEAIMKDDIKNELNSTTISRVLLMSQDADYAIFEKNVKSIKDKDKLKKVIKEIDKAVDSIKNFKIDDDDKNGYYIFAIRHYFTKLKYEKRVDGGKD